MKLHKLLYYAQTWHLAAAGEPLFHEQIEAWDNGPVVADLWRDEKRERPPSRLGGLTASERVTVDYVMQRYGSLTGRDLIRLTHAEAPWSELYQPGASNPLPHEVLARSVEHDEGLSELRRRQGFMSDDLAKTLEERRQGATSHGFDPPDWLERADARLG